MHLKNNEQNLINIWVQINEFTDKLFHDSLLHVCWFWNYEHLTYYDINKSNAIVA